jgi:hypothetical protein
MVYIEGVETRKRRTGDATMATKDFTVGDLVRFAEVLEPGDDLARFVVVEDNGDRLIIRLVCNMSIPPTSVVLRSDLVRA